MAVILGPTHLPFLFSATVATFCSDRQHHSYFPLTAAHSATVATFCSDRQTASLLFPIDYSTHLYSVLFLFGINILNC